MNAYYKLFFLEVIDIIFYYYIILFHIFKKTRPSWSRSYNFFFYGGFYFVFIGGSKTQRCITATHRTGGWSVVWFVVRSQYLFCPASNSPNLKVVEKTN